MANIVVKEPENIIMAQDEKLLKKSLLATKNAAIKDIENHDFDNAIGSGSAYIITKVLKTPEYFAHRFKCTKTDWELADAFDTFVEICLKANEKTVFVPTINTFCAFCNITKKQFLLIAQENTQRGEVASLIFERLSDNILQNMLSDKINTVAGIFVSKANFNMRDNETPQVSIVNVQNIPTDIDTIMEEFNRNKEN